MRVGENRENRPTETITMPKLVYVKEHCVICRRLIYAAVEEGKEYPPPQCASHA